MIRERKTLPRRASWCGGQVFYQALVCVLGDSQLLLPQGIVEGERNAIIVVVSDSWVVSCFDHELSKLWERTLTHAHSFSGLGKMAHYEIAIEISDDSIRTGRQGLVLVGGSMRHSAILDQEEMRTENQTPEALDEEFEVSMHLHRFALYAIDARSGELLWTHDGSNAAATDDDEDPEDIMQRVGQHKLEPDDAEKKGLAGRLGSFQGQCPPRCPSTFLVLPGRHSSQATQFCEVSDSSRRALCGQT